MNTSKKESTADVYYELSFHYPKLVAVGREFKEYMSGDGMWSLPETNVLVLQSLITGWVYAAPWFHAMSDEILRRYPRENVYLVVSDKALEAATDATIGDVEFSQE